MSSLYTTHTHWFCISLSHSLSFLSFSLFLPLPSLHFNLKLRSLGEAEEALKRDENYIEDNEVTSVVTGGKKSWKDTDTTRTESLRVIWFFLYSRIFSSIFYFWILLRSLIEFELTSASIHCFCVSSHFLFCTFLLLFVSFLLLSLLYFFFFSLI